MSNKVDSFGTSYSFKKINEKEPIIFIHGVGLAKEIWDPQVNFFKDYNTVNYDLLGQLSQKINNYISHFSAKLFCV